MTASIWERTTDNGRFHTVTFERRYRDAKDVWHSTLSFDKNNLLTLAKLADQVDTEIARLTRKEAAAQVAFQRGGLRAAPNSPLN